jgi:hypothetical protein
VDSKSGVQQMKKFSNHTNDDGDFDERDLLKDGRVYRPAGGLMMMDSAMPRRPNVGRVSTLDGDPMSLHRPGWRVPARDTCDPLPRHVVTDADRQAIIDARQNYLNELTSAWKHPRGLRDDDPITGAGAPNIKASGNDAMPVDDIETAYRLYAEEISQAWKSPR